ncbi:MAG: hypothetical protein ABI604_12410 [Nitrospirota bacterium]
MMKLHKILLMAVVLIVPANVWAYGDNSAGGSGTGICKKVNFSEFSPPNNSEAAPQSKFSFYASEATNPKSIKVMIKGQSVPLTVVAKQSGFKVSGELPAMLKAGYAKIKIDAKGIAQCEVSDGWLIKVTGEPGAAAKAPAAAKGRATAEAPATEEATATGVPDDSMLPQ